MELNDRIAQLITNVLDVAGSNRSVKDKLASRKLWVSGALILVFVLGMFNVSNSVAVTIAYIVGIIVAAAMYMICEGAADVTRIRSIIDAVAVIDTSAVENKSSEDEMIQALEDALAQTELDDLAAETVEENE